jgi:hypothetical protein
MVQLDLKDVNDEQDVPLARRRYSSHDTSLYHFGIVSLYHFGRQDRQRRGVRAKVATLNERERGGRNREKMRINVDYIWFLCN